MKCDILCYYDIVGYEDDVTIFNHVLKQIKFVPTSITTTYDILTQSDLTSKDIIFIDYGGLSSQINYCNTVRYYHNLIIENHDKQFVFALTMPEWFYASEEIFKEPNVKYFDRFDIGSFEKLFELYRS